MKLLRRLSLLFPALVLLAVSLASDAATGHDDDHDGRIKHALLICVGGLHALDLTNYVATHPNSTLAQLSAHGKTYPSQPSDSFPGLASLVTSYEPIAYSSPAFLAQLGVYLSCI